MFGDELPLSLIVHHTASLTPGNICQFFTQLLPAGLLFIYLSICDIHFSLWMCASTFSSEVFFVSFLSVALYFLCLPSPSAFFPPLLSLLSFSSLSLGQSGYICQLPPVLEHLSSTSPPSIYLEAIFILPRSLCSVSLSFGSSYTDSPNLLFYYCSFPPISSSPTLFRLLCR